MKRSLLALSALALTATLSASITARAGLVDMKALVAQVPLCRVVHSFVKAPCASKLLGDILLPHLTPIEVTGLKASKTIIKLDNDGWAAKAADWVNRGLDWLGLPSRYRVPKEIKVEIGISMSLSNVQLRLPKGREYQPEFGATIGVVLEGLNGLIKGKRFGVRGRVEGRVYLTVAPLRDDCLAKKPNWAMGIVNLELTKLDVDKIPDFIDGSGLFLTLLNWGLSKMYDDYPEYASRGIAFCIRGNCPLPKKAVSAAPKKEGILKLGGLTAQNRYLTGSRRPDGGFAIQLRDASILCSVTNAVMNAGCIDGFVTSMANSILPLRAPLPQRLMGQGVSAVAQRFALDQRDPRTLRILAAAGLEKTGQAEKLAMTLGASLSLNSQCTRDSFLLAVKPTIESVGVSKIPSWVLNGVARAAVNGALKPMDFCPADIAVKKLGKKVSICKVTNALLKEQCTGPFVNAVAQSLFPLSVRPSEATMVQGNANLQRLLQGIVVTAQGLNVNMANPNSPTVGVRIAIQKQGHADALVTDAQASFGVQTKCGKGASALRITPALTSLSVSGVPKWLLQATVVNLGNEAISRWHAICAYGACKDKQKIDVRVPGFGLGGGGAKPAPTCNFDTFQAAR
jgi:hypothetical protein